MLYRGVVYFEYQNSYLLLIGVAEMAAETPPSKSVASMKKVETRVTSIAMPASLCRSSADYVRICHFDVGNGMCLYVAAGDVRRIACSPGAKSRNSIGGSHVFDVGAILVAELANTIVLRDVGTAKLNHQNQACKFVPLDNIVTLVAHREGQRKNTRTETTRRLKLIHEHIKSQTDGSSPSRAAMAIAAAAMPAPLPPPPIVSLPSPEPPPPPPSSRSIKAEFIAATTTPLRPIVGSMPGPGPRFCNIPLCLLGNVPGHPECVVSVPYPPYAIAVSQPPMSAVMPAGITWRPIPPGDYVYGQARRELAAFSGAYTTAPRYSSGNSTPMAAALAIAPALSTPPRAVPAPTPTSPPPMPVSPLSPPRLPRSFPSSGRSAALLTSPQKPNPYYYSGGGGLYDVPSMTDTIRSLCPPSRELYCTGVAECPECHGSGTIPTTYSTVPINSARKRARDSNGDAPPPLETSPPHAKRPNVNITG